MKYDLIIDFEMCNVVGKMRKKAGGMRNEIIQIGAPRFITISAR